MDEEEKKRMSLVFENSSTAKLMVKLIVPAIISMLVNIVYNLADTFFIGKLNEPLMVSALSVSTPIFAFTQAFNLLLGGGASVAIGIALGKKETEKVKNFSSFAFYFSIMLGIIIAVVVNIFPYWFAKLLGASDNFASYTVSYIRILCGGAPFILLSGVCCYLIKSDGSSMNATITGGIGTILNIILDPLFILVFKFGVAGAAAASIIGYAVSAIIGLIFLLKRRDRFSIRIQDFRFTKDIAWTTIFLGIPHALSTMISSLSSTVANKYLVSYGDIVVAANGIAYKASYVIMMVCMGIALGMQPAISYFFGKRDLKRMNNIIKRTTILTLIVGLTMTVFMFIFRNQFINIFIKNDELLEYGQKIMLISLIASPITGLYQVCTMFLQATGKVSYATLVSILRQGCIYIPLLILLNTLFGFNGCICTSPVTNVLAIIMASMFCLNWYKKIKKDFASDEINTKTEPAS